MYVLGLLCLLLAAAPLAAENVDPNAVAARVGGEPIYLGEILEGAGSLALVGEEKAGERPGTRERLLERLVVARLLYLDGRDRGVDRTSRCVEALRAFGDRVLAARYRERLRRQGTVSQVDVANVLRADGLGEPPSSAAERRLWIAAGLAAAARRRGLDRDAGFQEMVDGFRVRKMIELVREEIVAREGLDEAGVEREYREHRDRFTAPEQRRVQRIVVRTRAEAEEIRGILAAPAPGVSFYTVARDRSIAPEAKVALGVVGWVGRDGVERSLATVAFALAPGEISEPMETDAGFQLVRVLDRREAETIPLDADTASRIRARWNANRIHDYARRLARERYDVELFPEVYQVRSGAATSAPPG